MDNFNAQIVYCRLYFTYKYLNIRDAKDHTLTHTHTHSHTHTLTHPHTHTLTHSHTHTLTHSHSKTHTLTHTHTNLEFVEFSKEKKEAHLTNLVAKLQTYLLIW